MKNSTIARVDSDFYRHAKRKAQENDLSFTELTNKLIPNVEAIHLEASEKLGLKPTGRRKKWI